MGKAPAWATNLLVNVYADANRIDVPELTWRHRKTGSVRSTGHTKLADYVEDKDAPDGYREVVLSPPQITITAGRERRDQRLLLLHEIAHALSPVGTHHGPEFWDTAWRLYRRYGVPVRYALGREADSFQPNRVGARAGYLRSHRALYRGYEDAALQE